MRGDTGFSHKAEPEQDRVKHGDCVYIAEEGHWWYAPGGLQDGVGECIVAFDPDDGTGLLADGTTQAADADAGEERGDDV